MKKIYLILVAVLLVQACSSDDDANVKPDDLMIQITGGSLGEEATPFEVGDGNWGLDLKATAEGKLELQIDTDQPWKMVVENLQGGQDNWFAPDTLEGVGVSVVSVNVSNNSKSELRATSIAVNTTGAIPATKKITVRQRGVGFLDVEWDKEFLVSEVAGDSLQESLVMEAKSYTEVAIGTIDTKSENVEVTSSEDWADIKIEEGIVLLNLDENKNDDESRSTVITLKDDEEGLQQSIELIQRSKEAGVLEVQWSEKYIKVEEDQDSVLIFKAKAYSEELIGSYETDSETTEIKTESSEKWAEIKAVEGKIIVDLEENESYEKTRSATLTLTNPNGGVSQTIELKQGPKTEGTLDVQWNNDYIYPEDFGDETFIFAPTGKAQIEIGEYDADTEDLEAASSESWAKIEIDKESGRILLDLDENSGSKTRKATLTLTNPNAPDGGIEHSIDLTQYGTENILDKNQWSVKAGNDNTSAFKDGPFSNLIDGDPNTHWEWDWQWDWGNDDSSGIESKFPDVPYEFIIDFSEAQVFNTVKLWQTQKSNNGYVKDVQFMVSDNGSDWEDLGEYRMAGDQEDAEANYQDPYVYKLPSIYNARYIKLVILSNVGGSKVNVDNNAFMGELDVSFE